MEGVESGQLTSFSGLVGSLPPRSILQQPNINLRPRQHDIAHDTPTNKHVLHRRQMWVLVQIEHVDIIELDVQVLVDGFEGTADADVVFELDGHGLVCEGLEEAEEEHGGGSTERR
jgi:hypothetical protein